MATASIAGLHGNFGTALYVASKHGVIGFVKSMALAERELGVKVVAICPAYVLQMALQPAAAKRDDDTELTLVTTG